MLVSGAPQRREDHAQEMAGMALNMLQEMKNIQNPATKENLQLQIGMLKDVLDFSVGRSQSWI